LYKAATGLKGSRLTYPTRLGTLVTVVFNIVRARFEVLRELDQEYTATYFLFKIFISKRPTITHVYQQRNNRIGILAAILAKSMSKPLLFTEYGLLHDHYLVDDRDDPLGKPLKPNGLVFNLKQIFTKSLLVKLHRLVSNIKNYFFTGR